MTRKSTAGRAAREHGDTAAPKAPAASSRRSSAPPKGTPRLAPVSRFYSRAGRLAAIAMSFFMGTLCIGVIGYHFIAQLPWIASFHQASLQLSGMGPVETNLRGAGRIFESVYSLFCGIVLLGSAGLLFAPLIHRLLHRFHVEDSVDQ